MQPFVSIIIPSKNEKKFILRCLGSITENDYPKDKMEILVVDGMSRDGTRELVKEYSAKYSFIKILDNPREIKAPALNKGIKEARGEVIMIMDAHSFYKKDYISRCIQYLKKYKADNVGGVIKTVPAEKTIIAEAIAISLSHPFGTGGAYFRTGSKKIRWVDTVFGGCYKKEVFKKIGLFNENLIRSQDMEFNLRLKRAGGRILLVPEIRAFYYPSSNFEDFFVHNFQDGVWSVYILKFIKKPLRLRHYLPLIFVLTLPLNIWLYIPVVCYFSLRIALREKDLRYLFLMPIVFADRHIGYGLGSIWGIIKLLRG
ncbi:MAG TPA: glycosyltransferase family 2 protein [Candidatus Paceibacterota bacterium]|nr:glycosyltransferase family 2 protein [Candidatus Paceibacterota bacterium]